MNWNELGADVYLRDPGTRMLVPIHRVVHRLGHRVRSNSY